MPPKSDYWKYFVVQGVLAICQLQGCPKPNVSLGALPKPGQKKRISEYILYITAAHYHKGSRQEKNPEKFGLLDQPADPPPLSVI